MRAVQHITTVELLPLPVASARIYQRNNYRRASVLPGPGAPLFTAEDMHAYARAHIAQRAASGDAPTVGDPKYFERKLAIITRDISHYTAQELARELVRMAKVACLSETVKEAGSAPAPIADEVTNKFVLVPLIPLKDLLGTGVGIHRNHMSDRG